MREYRRRQSPRRRPGPGDLITASEIAGHAFCPEAWRLQHGLGLQPSNQAALDAGRRHHARKATAERVAGGACALGRLVVLAVMTLLLFLVLSR
jgi:hypothetical protein